jgi:Protein phosphatase 2C
MIKVTTITFQTPKEGESAEDCQDSIHPVPGANGVRNCAVADGATQSFFPRLWAQLLTEHFATGTENAFRHWADWLREPQQVWQEKVRERVEAVPNDVFASNNLNERKPAAATFVGRRLLDERDDEIPWEALVLGDSCLFHLREGGIVRSYFKTTSDEFSFVTDSAESYAKPSARVPE